ncbi:MAG: carboxylating nicotinate-nucleotide diphosphorylase [Hyphomicrobiales bacterium]|nr:carboxylating nicotinate-nucleotide diphosphorylase [Hyphomicrobiales bacterium]
MLAPHRLDALIDLWFDEDIGAGDLTATLMIAAGAQAAFVMRAREPLVLAGAGVAARVFTRFDASITVTGHAEDGTHLPRGGAVMEVSGPARSLLTAERTALNIVQHLSGIATLTARYVEAISGTGARLIDTRKTTPGLRELEKYAVRCGGGNNHRLRLDGGVLIKDNHLTVSGDIGAAIATARAGAPLLTKVEVECDTLLQVEAALAARADVILLDNMSLEDLRTAVRLVGGRIPLEASGGVHLETIGAIAATGVDYISTSRITQAAPAPDIGLDEL